MTLDATARPPAPAGIRPRPRVLVTGATGFVGSHLVPILARTGADVVGATRDVERAHHDHSDREFVLLDLLRPETVQTALRGCTQAVDLVHGRTARSSTRIQWSRATESPPARGVRPARRWAFRGHGRD